MKQKAFFIIIKGLSIVINCLRTKSGLLNDFFVKGNYLQNIQLKRFIELFYNRALLARAAL